MAPQCDVIVVVVVVVAVVVLVLVLVLALALVLVLVVGPRGTECDSTGGPGGNFWEAQAGPRATPGSTGEPSERRRGTPEGSGIPQTRSGVARGNQKESQDRVKRGPPSCYN